jgi:predicted nuclease of predicted toxin-antitoxin system
VRFLADVGVSLGLVRWLRGQGHDAVHLRDEGLHRLSDGEIFQKAASEGRVILTFDLDFGEIVALADSAQPSVIVFRLRNTRTAHVIERLSEALRSSANAVDLGAVVVVEESRHRIRRLPIGEVPR